MDQGNVQSLEGVTLVGGGTMRREDLVDSMALAPNVIAADGGANRCIQMGISPLAVIGDFDSILPDTRAALPKARMIEVSEQDSTDFEKSLSRIDAPFVLAVGFSGSRVDHLLATFSVMARRVGPPVILLAEDDIVFAAPDSFEIDLDPGSRVSLFPMVPITGTSTGLRWPIDDVALDPMGMVGTSNQATGPVRLDFDQPGCLVILSRSALATALDALRG